MEIKMIAFKLKGIMTPIEKKPVEPLTVING
jgi:hypothetical protein